MGATGTNTDPGPAADYKPKQEKTHLNLELIATEDVSSNRNANTRKRGRHGGREDRGTG